jgi:DNA modification methylase
MIKASEHGQKRVHPTQKPVALFTWCAEKYGQPGDIVFDPFLGSGISVIGCEQLNDDRTVFGFELSPEYMEITCRRYELLTGDTAKLVGHL